MAGQLQFCVTSKDRRKRVDKYLCGLFEAPLIASNSFSIQGYIEVHSIMIKLYQAVRSTLQIKLTAAERACLSQRQHQH